MTDNEIIRAMNECINNGYNSEDGTCRRCPLENFSPAPEQCMNYLLELALSLINRQKVELDDLKRDDLPRCKDALRRANEIGMALEKENQELKAEVERLIQAVEELADESDARDIDEYNMVCRVRVDAIKQFADRLEAIYKGDNRYDRPNAHTLIVKLFDNIDNLVKEMVGGNNDM